MFKWSSVWLESFSLTLTSFFFLHVPSSHWWHSCSLTQDILETLRFSLPPPGISCGSQKPPCFSGLCYSTAEPHVLSALIFTEVLLLTSCQWTEWKPWAPVGMAIWLHSNCSRILPLIFKPLYLAKYGSRVRHVSTKLSNPPMCTHFPYSPPPQSASSSYSGSDTRLPMPT